eukprot:763591-Hanusia_phi.AAC.1
MMRVIAVMTSLLRVIGMLLMTMILSQPVSVYSSLIAISITLTQEVNKKNRLLILLPPQLLTVKLLYVRRAREHSIINTKTNNTSEDKCGYLQLRQHPPMVALSAYETIDL